MPLVHTNRRVRRKLAPLVAVQSARGVVAGDFTAAGAERLWTREAWVDPDVPKSPPGPWMTELGTEAAASRYGIADQPRGQIFAVATPKALELLLRSNWGPFAAGAFTLASQISEWMTLGYVEDVTAGSPQNLVRAQDCFFHRLAIEVSRSEGKLHLRASYDGRRNVIDPLDALPGGVVLPAPPMAPADTRAYGVRKAELVREPAGQNASLLYERLEIILDQRVTSEWTQTDKWDVYKCGKTKAWIRFDGMATDETWQSITDNRAGTKRHFRLAASTAPFTPLSFFQMDFYSVDFELERLGHGDRTDGLIAFRAVGRATKRADGKFVEITLT